MHFDGVGGLRGGLLESKAGVMVAASLPDQFYNVIQPRSWEGSIT